MRKKFGGNVPNVKAQATKNRCKIHLVLAPNYNMGKALVDKMGWQEDRAAVITNPNYLKGVNIHPNEEIYALTDTPIDMLDSLLTYATNLKYNESFTVKFIKV